MDADVAAMRPHQAPLAAPSLWTLATGGTFGDWGAGHSRSGTTASWTAAARRPLAKLGRNPQI